MKKPLLRLFLALCMICLVGMISGEDQVEKSPLEAEGAPVVADEEETVIAVP